MTFETCPGPDALIAEAEGYGLESIRRHLVVCDECRRIVKDLRDWPDIQLPPGVEPPTEEETERSLKRFWKLIERLEEN